MSNNAVEPKRHSILRAVLRVAGWGFLCGILLHAVVFFWELGDRASHMDAFRKIGLGTPSTRAADVLRDDDVWCLSKQIADGCYFSDLWRNYEIAADPATNQVTSKSFHFKVRQKLTERILNSVSK